MNVLLHNTSSLFIGCRLYDNLFNLFIVLSNLDSIASVGVFAWLDDPNVLFRSSIQSLILNSRSSKCLLVCLSCLLLLHLLFFLHVILLESGEFRVFKSLFDMEGVWNSCKHILSHCFVVDSHVKEHSLLVTQVVVVFKLVVQFNT